MEMNDSSESQGPRDALDFQRFLESLALISDDVDGGTGTPASQNTPRVHDGPKDRPSPGVLDVAEYILSRLGCMSTMKLQKLVYYCQAWSLVWDEAPLFPEEIQAWANGPVIPRLFNFHRGMYDISRVIVGNPDLLSKSQRETIDAVLGFYGDKPAQWLIDLSHGERPWKEARGNLAEAARGNKAISLESMANYYSSLNAES